MPGTLNICLAGNDVPYRQAVALQETIHQKRISGQCRDTLILLQHRPVYTLGRSADRTHVLLNRETLAKVGIEVVECSRGGDVTYHGPGQLVGYPIVQLREREMGVLDYVTALEETVIGALRTIGISNAGRDGRNRGVWINGRKICAIGIRVSRQTTMHGFALNVNTRLQDFGGIVPCGLHDVGVTSVANELGHETDMAKIAEAVVENFLKVFGYDAIEETFS